MEELQKRVRELEAELQAIKKQNKSGGREKISQMSSEVVDSNPYRYVCHKLFNCNDMN